MFARSTAQPEATVPRVEASQATLAGIAFALCVDVEVGV